MELNFLRPDFYFFTHPANLNSQTSSEAFGATSSTEFRLNSMHTATGTAPAFAVCRGTVFIQETTGSRVNLVLKPLMQPRHRLGQIAYFIYKGIDKSSLIDGDDATIGSPSLNDLTSALWDNQAKLNAEILEATGSDPGTNPPKEVLTRALDSSAAETALLSAFVNSSSDYQLPMVSGGDHLGDFDASDFGFEIVLERLGHEMTLGDVRTHDQSLTVSALSGGETEAQVMDHWHEKDAILNRIDPAAFWASFYRAKLQVWNGADFDVKKKNDLYTDVLSSYYNKNKVYLDLRNDQNNWLNHAADKDLTVKWGLGEEPGTWTDAVITDTGWPLLVLDKTNFAGAGCSDNHQILQLKIPLGDVTDAYVHLVTGWTPDRFPKDARQREAFLRTNPDESPSTPISIAIPLYNQGSTTDTPMCSWTTLRVGRGYFGSEKDKIVSSSQLSPIHHLDYLFAPFAMADSLPGIRQLESRVFYDGRYVDDVFGRHQDYVAAIGIAKGVETVSLFAFPIEKNHNNDISPEPLLPIAEIFTEGSDEFKSELETLKGLWSTTRKYSLEDGSTVTQARTGRRTLDPQTFDPNFGDLTALTFKASEFIALETLAGSSGFSTDYPVYFCFSETERTNLKNGYRRLKYQILLTGYVLDAGIYTTTQIESGHYLTTYGRI